MTELEAVIQRCHRARSTKNSYRSAVRAFLRSLPDEGEVQWTRENVQRWVDTLAARGLRYHSIQQYLTGLRYAARKLGLNFADGIEAPGDHRAKTLSDAEVSGILAWDPIDAHSVRDRALVALCLGAGWSQSDLLQSQIRDVHDACLAPCIRDLVEPWTQRFYPGDPLAPPVTRRIQGLDIGSDPVTAQTLTKALRRRADELGWQTIRIRDLRATFRRLAGEAGFPAAQTAEYITTHRTPQEALERLEARLAPLIVRTKSAPG